MRSSTYVRAWLLGLCALCAFLPAPPAEAGQSPTRFPGPPAPVAPAVIARDPDGRTTVRAVRLTEPIRVDGQLDEAFYRDVPAMSGFIQMEPQNGAPATERTETWLAFDDRNVYVMFRNWDTQMDRLVATEMRRDSNVMFQGNDVVLFLFDTFFDRRNNVMFTINPLGGRQEGQVTNERLYNPDWNPVWEVKTGRFDGGWTVEAAVPFKSLKYSAGTEQVWGFNAMRIKRSKNEVSALTALPSYRGASGFQISSLAATAVGLQAPAGGRSLDIKPYVTSSLSTDRTLPESVAHDPNLDVGVDVKYGVTQNLTADLTYKTDFAQVEADEQQINLTRFNLFFPEKREFFLENQGTFSFGGVPLQGNNAASSVAPILFYSRRIGLNQGVEVPLDYGGRLTGRMGPFSVGAVGIRTGEEAGGGTPATAFSVVRLKRDIFRRSSVGLIYTGRSQSPTGGANNVYGVDGTFSFFESMFVNTYWARSATEGAAPDPRPRPGRGDTSYRAQLDYNGDRYGVQLERMNIGANFTPEAGLVRRDDVARDFALVRFSPRPARRGPIRKYFSQASIEYIENTAGQLESRDRSGELALEFQNADRVSVGYSNALEALPAPFRIGGVTLPVGVYRFDTFRAGYNMGQQRPLSANITLEHGTFYSGRKTTLGIARGRALINTHVAVEPTYSLNRVHLAEGAFTTHLLGSRATYTMTPLMFASALVQYNSGTRAVSTNARLRWEYRPGSELFVVYNEDRSTVARGFPGLSTRSFIVKVNRLFRF